MDEEERRRGLITLAPIAWLSMLPGGPGKVETLGDGGAILLLIILLILPVSIQTIKAMQLFHIQFKVDQAHPRRIRRCMYMHIAMQLK